MANRGVNAPAASLEALPQACDAVMGLCGESGNCKCATLCGECKPDSGAPRTPWPYAKPA